MKNKYHFFIVSMFLVFIACNKNQDIFINNPPSESDKSLGYQVVEYLPAPGQYINEKASGFNDFNTMDQACSYAQARLEQNQYVSLGSWGGYIIVRFDKSINNSGGYDFAISGNSFDSSSEPGIVWVMQDTNQNSIPDDEWFELKGSYFGQEGYERNYWVTYYRPAAKEPTLWEDSNGESGYVQWLGNYHSQDFYYPQWVKEDSYTLYGSRLPLRAYQNEITHQWQNDPFEWGYADNYGEDFSKNDLRNYFKISDAVTFDNLPANLSSIDFVKVQTAINGNAGLLGENSTEVTGFYYLND